MTNGGYYLLDMGGIPDIEELASSGGITASAPIPGLVDHIGECVRVGKPLMLCGMKTGNTYAPPVGAFVRPTAQGNNEYELYVPGIRIMARTNNTITAMYMYN